MIQKIIFASEKGEYPYESDNSWGDSQEYCRVTYRVLPELSLNGEMVLARTFVVSMVRMYSKGFDRTGKRKLSP